MTRLAVFALLLASASAHAEVVGRCHVINVELQPHSSDLQIVAWVEDPAGTYLSTIFITQQTGTFGLGNRPGRYDFNSGPRPRESPQIKDLWPYGRRITVFPVWSHRHGLSFPEVVFQNGDEDNLSHPFMESSRENHFCRPQVATEATWDTGTCASTVFTDKGSFSINKSGYPPRADVTRSGGLDSPSVDMYRMLNPFDAVSAATPIGGTTADINWPIPKTLAPGDYVMWVEVSREFDFNASYNSTSYPAPTGIPWADYGKPYRGQPSVLYKVPFTIGTTETIASSKASVGYGDPTGATGTLHPIDASITTDTPGTGTSRLDILSGTDARVRVDSRPENDSIAPGVPQQISQVTVTSQSATVSFTASGDDGYIGKATGYEVRVRATNEMTPDNFSDSMAVTSAVVPSEPGSTQMLEVDGLLPETDYWIGVRAYDDCHNTSDIAIVQVRTADRLAGEVNACFIATAAYGSLMANDVEPLRHFRDAMLRSSALGELALETYYTFGPAVAGVIGESELLRSTARDVLRPIVAWTRAFTL